MRPPHKTVFPSRGPPGSRWRRCQALGFRGKAAGARPSVHPFTPPSSPGVTRGGVVFPPTPEAVLARTGIAGPLRFGEPWNPSPPRPSHSAAGAGGSKEAGICFKRLRLETQPLTKSELVLDLPQPCRLWSRRRPAAVSAAGGTGSSPAVRQSAEPERSTAEVARPDLPGLPCGGSGRRAG